jgi:type II secretory pathway predicted ATPase ExeA
MYNELYGFHEKPFKLTPDPAFLYLSEQHEMALSMLNYGLQNEAAITVITGEVGAGKTTLIREVLRNMSKDVEVGLITNAHNGFGDLLQLVLFAFDITTDTLDKASRYKVLTDFLINNYANNKATVLIVDEAQNMDVDTLEELRLISNINVDKHMVLQLVLVGQPEFLEKLQRDDLRQLAQRVSVDYMIKPLGYRETKAYIKHRLVVAGGEDNILDKYAIAAVYYYSCGIPRLINTLCDFALVFGFSEGLQHISLDIVLDVIKGKQAGGILPMVCEENMEQAKVRQLVKQEKGVDIQLIAEESDDEEIFEL